MEKKRVTAYKNDTTNPVILQANASEAPKAGQEGQAG
jgi:hypothetical protein